MQCLPIANGVLVATAPRSAFGIAWGAPVVPGGLLDSRSLVVERLRTSEPRPGSR
jgi:hypothetical protein